MDTTTHTVFELAGKGQFRARPETRSEREARERSEAIAKQKAETNRLRDWFSRLEWKMTQHEDGLRDARISVEMNLNGIETTRTKIAQAKRDLADAQERLTKMEKTAA